MRLTRSENIRKFATKGNIEKAQGTHFLCFQSYSDGEGVFAGEGRDVCGCDGDNNINSLIDDRLTLTSSLSRCWDVTK